MSEGTKHGQNDDDGADEPRLEGALHVRCGGELPRPQAGSTILIESA